MDSHLDWDELVADWTLASGEPDLVAGKRSSTRLGFALQLKFYGRHGRFISDSSELSEDVVEFVARQVDVESEALAERGRADACSWRGQPMAPALGALRGRNDVAREPSIAVPCE